MNQCIVNADVGVVLKRRDRNGNFCAWPLDEAGTAVQRARMVVLLGTAGRSDLCSGRHVPYRITCHREDDHVDFGRLAEKAGTAFARSQGDFANHTPFCEPRAGPSHFKKQPEFRTRPFAESPEVAQKIRDAFAGAYVGGAEALVVYDPLLLGGRIRRGTSAAPYTLAVIGKTGQDVLRACAAVSLVDKGARSYDAHDLDNEAFLLESTRRVRIIGLNGTLAAVFNTAYNPPPDLDTLLRKGGWGTLASIAVSGLCQVQGSTALIATEALRLCMECARFDERR